MIINRKFIITTIQLIISTALIYAVPAGLFNSNLSQNEINELDNGNSVVRNLSTYKKLTLDSNSTGNMTTADGKSDETAEVIKGILAEIKKNNPAYIAEVIKTYPYEGNENLIETFHTEIIDVDSYVGIPYYSEHAQEWYDLYSSAVLKSKETDGNKEVILADMDMLPFGLINTEITTVTGEDYFYYESTNLNKLRYFDKFDCVNPRCMKSYVVLFRAEDQWILYAIGAVNAPDIFFLRSRIETSFMNRISTFCKYFFDKH